MLDKIKGNVDKNILRESFIFTFILGLIAHGYCFLNLLVSHDSLNDFYVYDQWERANFGRIFYSIYISLTRGRLVLPWLIGMLALCWISAAVYLIAKMFEVEKSGLILLISGICVTNPTVYALAATYIHDLDADMLAMMISVASVYMWYYSIKAQEKKEKYLCLFCGALLLSISLGIYQSFIALCITLVVFYSIKELLEQKHFENVLINGCYAIAMIIAAAILYIVELKIFELLTGVSTMNASTYNGVGNVSQAFSGNVVHNVLNTYIDFINAFKTSILTSYPESFSIIFLGITAVLIVVTAFIGLKKLQWKSRILLVVLSVILPFSMNITFFLSGGTTHVLTQYAVWMLYLLAVILVQWNGKKVLYILLAGSLLFTITENIQTSNSIYVKKDLEFQASLSYMTRVVDRMEEQEDYIPGETPVLMIGEDVIGISKYGFEKYEAITGVSATGSVTYLDTYEDYFEYILGVPLNLCENMELQQDLRVKEMPIFPKENSVQMVDGILVVKLASDK